MSQLLINQVRLEQTRRQLSYLQEAVGSWFKERRAKDKHRQYHTQLRVLEGVLLGALDRIKAALEIVPTDGPRGELYNTCRVFDRRIAWVRRIWDYFRDKFDQRDDATFGKVLAAADEVVWSCYAEVFQRAAVREPDIKQGPAPLPYIELRYSPHAIPRAEPPPDLKSDVDAPFLQEYLRQLPIPIVALPANCVHDPWWLIYLGHEVGHHVQYDLLPDWQIVESFGEQIRNAVTSDPALRGDEQVAQRWVMWGREIFADLFSVLCMGPWALWTINELELSDERTMLKSKILYPSAITRLVLMQQVIRSLGLDPNVMSQSVKAMSRGSDADFNVLTLEQLDQLSLLATNEPEQAVIVDLSIAPKVAAAIVGLAIGEAGPIRQLCGWNKMDFEPYRTVYHLATELLQSSPPQPLRNLRGARLYTSAAIAAWASVTTDPNDEQRHAKMEMLTKNMLPAISESREEGTRAAREYVAGPDIEKLSDELSRLAPDNDAWR